VRDFGAGWQSSTLEEAPVKLRIGSRERWIVSLSLAGFMMVGLGAQQRQYGSLDLFSLSGVRYNEPSPVDVKAKKAKPAALPPWLTALNGRPVEIEGFILPYETNASVVTEFMLVSNSASCCFAPPAAVTEWVAVTIKGNGYVHASTDKVIVRGTFSVGEQFDEAGWIESLYRILADGVITTPEPQPLGSFLVRR
jgi:hypothetical protein